MKKIGFMQGRLSPLVNGQIQSFPFDVWDEEFPQAQKLGFECVEWTLDYPKLKENPLLINKDQEKISYLSEKYNLSVPSVTLDCCMQRPFWKAKQKKFFNELVSDFNLIIEKASNLGVEILVLPLVDNGSIKRKNEFEVLKGVLEDLYGLLKVKKIKIAFESDFPPQELSKFINKFNNDLIGINYDIGNSASLGYDAKHEFLEYGSRIFNVHIKDRLYKGTTVRLGKGNADFEKVFSFFSNNYSGNFILQTARSDFNRHYEELKINLAFLDKFFNKFNKKILK